MGDFSFWYFWDMKLKKKGLVTYPCRNFSLPFLWASQQYKYLQWLATHLNNNYLVKCGKLKPWVVVLVVLESNSVVVLDIIPPMRSIPAGLCQDTCHSRSSDREWDCSHSPLNVRQLVPIWVSVSTPPQAVSDDCVCPHRPGAGSLGRRQLRSPGSHISAVCWPSPSPQPPVINSPENGRLLAADSSSICPNDVNFCCLLLCSS